MQETPLTLFDVSTRLGVSPSAVKKRIAHLNIPVERGARGKLLFDQQAFHLLRQADVLLKSGQGFDDCRRLLGLERPEAIEVDAQEAPREGRLETTIAQALPEASEMASPLAETPGAQAAQVELAERSLPLPLPVRAASAEPPRMRPLATPVFIQLGRRKPSQEAPSQPALPPDLIGRLDTTLRLIEEKEKQNQSLQSKLLVAYDEMTKLSATAAAFQERSLNLQHEVNKLQSELRLLSAPVKPRPWWKIWG